MADDTRPIETRAHFAGRMAARGAVDFLGVACVAFVAGQCLPLLHVTLPAATLAQAVGFSAVANAAAIIIRILSAPDSKCRND